MNFLTENRQYTEMFTKKGFLCVLCVLCGVIGGMYDSETQHLPGTSLSEKDFEQGKVLFNYDELKAENSPGIPA